MEWVKSLQNTLESVSGHYESIFWECCEVAPSWERSSGKCHSRAFSIPLSHCLPGTVTELRSGEREGGREGGWGGGREKRKNEREEEEKRKTEKSWGLTGYYKDSSRRKGFYMQDAMCIIKTKHAAVTLVWNVVPSTSEIGWGDD